MVGGRRWFMAGLVFLVLFAAGHFGGFLLAFKDARRNPALADLTRAMREHKSPLLGLSPSLLDFREYFSLNFSILLLLAAALGFAAFSGSRDKASEIRTLSPVYVAVMVALLGTSAWFSVVQGLISCLVIGALFAVAWWRACGPAGS